MSSNIKTKVGTLSALKVLETLRKVDANDDGKVTKAESDKSETFRKAFAGVDKAFQKLDDMDYRGRDGIIRIPEAVDKLVTQSALLGSIWNNLGPKETPYPEPPPLGDLVKFHQDGKRELFDDALHALRELAKTDSQYDYGLAMLLTDIAKYTDRTIDEKLAFYTEALKITEPLAAKNPSFEAPVVSLKATLEKLTTLKAEAISTVIEWK